jgi:Protein of unknown function (DUF2934)
MEDSHMAKPSKPATPATPPSKPPASKPIARTEVRNSPIPQMAPPPRPQTSAPKSSTTTPPPASASRPATPQSASSTTSSNRPAAAAAKPVTHELIARRAYEIWASGQGGTEMENWIRAERELRGM